MRLEQGGSSEELHRSERLERVASFIASGIKPVRRFLDEAERQQVAIQEFESREYQLEALDALWQAREDGADRGLIHLATGLGKTSVAVLDSERFRLERLTQGKRTKILFVVHQNTILNQASERFTEILPHLRQAHSIKDATDPDVDITFLSFQSLAKHAASLPPDTFDYIIYDEAHHIEAETYKQVVEHFTPDFQLGLTATPERADEKDITAHFGEALYSKTLPEAIAEGHLATVNYNIIFDDAVHEAIESGFKPSSITEIQRLFDVEPRNEAIVSKIKVAQEQIKTETGINQTKTIIFCSNTEHADAIASLMNGESYHSGRTAKEQNEILSNFRANGLETITVRDMFNEGVDIPDARLIVFLRTTQSSAVFEQQLGRGLRKNKDKQEVTVLDFAANIERITSIKELAEKVGHSHTLTNTVGNTETLEEKISTGGEMTVHGTNSEFIFSQEVIDLLSKYQSLIDSQVDRRRLQDWTEEDVLKVIDDIFPGKRLKTKDMKKLIAEAILPSYHALAALFSSHPIAEINKRRGFETLKVKDLSNEDILDLAAKVLPPEAVSTGVIDRLRAQGIFVSMESIRLRFGGIGEFNKQRGYEPTTLVYKGELNCEDILRIIDQNIPGQLATHAWIQEMHAKRELPNSLTVAGLFGGIKNLNRARGLDVRDIMNLTNDEIIAMANKIAPGRAIGSAEITQLSKENRFVSETAIKKYFGTVNEFNRLRGLRPNRNNSDLLHLTDEELVRKSLEILPNGPLTTRVIVSLSKQGQFIGAGTISRRFGSVKEFNEARQAMIDSLNGEEL